MQDGWGHKELGVYAEVVRRMGDRGRFSDTVDSILYESADSYRQAQTIYLQNRRFQVYDGNPPSTEEEEDLFDEFFDEEEY